MATKKIKDLTDEEIKNICRNHPNCDNCPLLFVEKGFLPMCLQKIILNKVKIEKTLDEEIEVEE